MKNKLYKIIYFFCVSILVFVYSFNVYSLISWADVPSGQIVVGHEGNWSGLPFTYTTTGKYYTIQDPTGIPSGTYLSPKYYYTRDHEKFFVADSLNIFTYALNTGVGVIFEPNELNNFFTGFMNIIKATDTDNDKYARNGLYDSNDNFLGYVLNDISGCYYGGNTNVPDATDDGNYIPNLRNYYDYSSYNSPDYFTFYSISNEYILRNYDPALSTNQVNYFNEHITDFAFCDGIQNYYQFKFDSYSYTEYNNFIAWVNTPYCAIDYNDSDLSNWNKFTKNFVSGNELLASEFINMPGGSDYVTQLNYRLYDSNLTAFDQYITVNMNNMTMNVTNSTINGSLVKFNTGKFYMPFGFDNITFYKNTDVINQIENNLFTPDVFYNDSYNNYDSNNDNSIDAPLTIISQSVSNNSSIYDTSSENFYNYYDNGYYDQSSATTNITNITNNYYSGNDPDNPDNPDNPDDPSDVLSQILQALLRFFTAIGSVLGTILAGILSIFSEILESIATVTEDLTGISDFFGSIFAWIPEPVPQVLGLGFSICILCGIIKFIRG